MSCAVLELGLGSCLRLSFYGGNVRCGTARQGERGYLCVRYCLLYAVSLAGGKRGSIIVQGDVHFVLVKQMCISHLLFTPKSGDGDDGALLDLGRGVEMRRGLHHGSL